MSSISIVISTYGDEGWAELAWSRAYPSTIGQGAEEVVVQHYPKLAIGPARNLTAKKAKGDFLIHLDADDELDAGYVQAMREAIEGLPPEHEPSRTLFQPAVRYIRKGRMADPVLIPVKDLRHDNYLVVGTMVSRHLFEEVGGFSDYPHGFEDWSLWAKCWKSGARIQPVTHAFYHAHINPKSKHREMWRNRRLQVETHLRVQAELFPEGVT